MLTPAASGTRSGFDLECAGLTAVIVPHTVAGRPERLSSVPDKRNALCTKVELDANLHAYDDGAQRAVINLTTHHTATHAGKHCLNTLLMYLESFPAVDMCIYAASSPRLRRVILVLTRLLSIAEAIYASHEAICHYSIVWRILSAFQNSSWSTRDGLLRRGCPNVRGSNALPVNVDGLKDVGLSRLDA